MIKTRLQQQIASDSLKIVMIDLLRSDEATLKAFEWAYKEATTIRHRVEFNNYYRELSL